MYCGTARTATLGRLFRSAPYYLRAGVTLILGPTLTLIRPSSGRRHTRTSENAVKRKFVENLFCVGWVNRGKRKAGLLQEGGIRSVRLNSGVDCNRGANKRILQMRDFSQRGGRGGLASLLSCPAPGRPLYLEGEAADPLCNAYRPNLLLRLPPFRRLGRHPERALSREDEQPNFLELRKGEVRRTPLPRTPVNKGYLRRLRLPRLPRFGYDAKLLHHPQVVAHPPVFHGLAVPKAHEVHVVLAHRAPGRERAHKRPFVSAAHRQAACNCVPFSDQLLDLEVQVREGRAQHIGQASHRLRATVPSWRGLVVYELGGNELVRDVEVPPVQQLLVGAPKQGLVLFSRHGATSL